MKLIASFLFTLVFFSAIPVIAQEDELLTDIPKTKEEFIASEKKLLATINWLEKTPLNEQEAKRKQLNAIVTAWIINSPTVSLEVSAKTMPSSDKNKEMVIFFMAGWTRYSLENNYSKDVLQGTIAGLKTALGVYKNNPGIKKDKALDKLAAIDEKNELEAWVKKQLGIQ